ncbi:MAG: GMC family oxidoreductase [Actinomycetota bacterium]|nr:GMC family oxidoreductase [Actinomycetota bacterium]
MTARDFDAIIVGSGPGGSTAADVLTAAGWSVVVFEKGRNHLIDTGDPTRLSTDFSNDEIKFMIRHFLGPDPLLEPRTFRREESDGDRTHVGEVNNVASTVGGGGPHADGKVPRFREDDFRMLSEWGPVEGASVADWPIGYEDLEPAYAEAERLIGVAGEAGANPFAAPRSGPYPMPPGPPMYGALITSDAAERHGWHPYPAPTAVNSVPYDDRPACNNCGFCAFFGCPIHAKGDPVASLRRALLTGRAELRPETFVSRIMVRDGRATGVEYRGPDGQARTETAGHVIVAAGGMETPRLLLLSGLEHPMIGRNLMFHLQTYVMGALPVRVHGHKGRSVTHVHDDFVVPDAASLAAAREAGLPWFKGGMVEHAGPAHPILEAKLAPWGPGHKDAMRRSQMREHLWGFCMQGEDLPQPSNRVDLDPSVRDVRGVPALRVTYRPHAHEQAASAYYGPMMEDCLRTAGAEWALTYAAPGAFDPVPMSRHVAGTARMGTDPAHSVCDPWGRLHDVPNVVVADSSLFPTGAGYGPTLTLVALAIRNMGALAPHRGG